MVAKYKYLVTYHKKICKKLEDMKPNSSESVTYTPAAGAAVRWNSAPSLGHGPVWVKYTSLSEGLSRRRVTSLSSSVC